MEWPHPGGAGDPPLRFGVLICYEDVFPELARRAALLGADFLVNLSSEAWFAGSAEIPQHFQISRFRAIETRLPLVRCCNVGVTAFVDPAGRVVSMLEGSDRPGVRGWLRGRVPLARANGPAVRPVYTVYTAVGDVFAWLCALGAGAFVAAAALRSRPPGHCNAGFHHGDTENGESNRR